MSTVLPAAVLVLRFCCHAAMDLPRTPFLIGLHCAACRHNAHAQTQALYDCEWD